MRTILAIALLAALPALAQQPSPTMVQGYVGALERQRNEAQNAVALREGQLAEAAEREKALKEEIERLKKLCGKTCEPEAKK